MNISHIHPVEAGRALVKIAAGIKTKFIYKGLKAYQINKKMKQSEIMDALNMYPDEPSLQAKKKSGKR